MITLNNYEIEKATNGTWINKPEEIPIERVSFHLSQVQKGDFYFPYDSVMWAEENEHNLKILESAFKRGAVAIALPSNTKIKTTRPTLLVEHLRDAFRAFSKTSTEKTDAVKILVSGSFGKTGFKKQLYTLINKHKKTFAFLDSANQSLPIYRALTSIPHGTEVTIIEVAAPGYKISKTRAKYVNPDIAVITNIGPEHLKQHGGSIENVIENKSRIAYGMKDNGVMIIPNQKEYATKEKMMQYIHKINPTIEILTFGEEEDNNAFILEKRFTGFGWALKIKINEKEISFTLPFLEEYSVKAVLPILLLCDKLGLNLDEIVKEYEHYRHYPSSGNFYKITLSGKSFYLYDQSIRGILDGFKETLQIIGRMKPKKKGKKIALFSEFINFDESAVDVIDTDAFKELFKKSGLKSLYTINMFCEHINVLHNKSIWMEHRFNIEDIMDTVIENIAENDMLFVRATQKSQANKLIEKILKDATHVIQYY